MDTTTNENESETASPSSWTAPLPFPCQVRICEGQMLYPDSYEEQDLNAYIGSFIYGRSVRLYFDPKSYPPPIGEANAKLSDQNSAIFEKLRTDLQMAAFKNGQSIMSNGSADIRGRSKVLSARGTERTLAELICHYRFSVQWDDTGYFLPLGSGCATHKYHAKLGPDAIPRRPRARQQVEDDFSADFPDLSNSEDEGYTFFDVVNPSFEACCRALEHNFTTNDVVRAKALFDQLVIEKRRQPQML